MAEHNFEEPVPNSPLLSPLKALAPIFARVKVNQGVYCCPGNAADEKQGLKIVFVCLKKIQSLDFAHYELTLNPFCQHCPNTILIFVICR